VRHFREDIPSASLSLSATRSRDAVSYGDQDPDPIDVPQLLNLHSETGIAQLQFEIEKILRKAEERCMSEEGLAALRALVVEFADIWRVALSDEPLLACHLW
jgi:hypothetical protein